MWADGGANAPSDPMLSEATELFQTFEGDRMSDSKQSTNPNQRSSSNHADLQAAWHAVGRRLGELLGKMLFDKAKARTGPAVSTVDRKGPSH